VATDLLVFDACGMHTDCTLKASFVSMDDAYFDPILDQRPVSEWVQRCASHAFGDVYCVETEHIPGKLAVEVPIVG